jgi:hypothetical protein
MTKLQVLSRDKINRPIIARPSHNRSPLTTRSPPELVTSKVFYYQILATVHIQECSIKLCLSPNYVKLVSVNEKGSVIRPPYLVLLP